MQRASNDNPKKKCSNCLKGGKTCMTKLQVVLIFESDWLRKCYKFSDLSRGKAHVKQNKINPWLLLRLFWKLLYYYDVAANQPWQHILWQLLLTDYNLYSVVMLVSAWYSFFAWLVCQVQACDSFLVDMFALFILLFLSLNRKVDWTVMTLQT